MARSRVKSSININLGSSIIQRRVVAGVDKAAEDATDQLRDILTIPPVRTGIHYSKQPNRSSAPGEAPAPQTGTYAQGVGRTPVRVEGAKVVAQVASQGENAANLEFGTERMEPRPHVSLLKTDKGRRARIRKAFEIGARRVR